jgi:hypothetical protein
MIVGVGDGRAVEEVLRIQHFSEKLPSYDLRD